MRGYGGAALAAMALATAPVNAACWNVDETSAATIRELQSMLMVATLRCQVAGHEMAADYNRFLQANKLTIQKMNDRIKAHFIKTAGPVKGQTAYDAFVTSLANGYGAEGSSADVCGSMDLLLREAALMAGSSDGLLMLAARQGLVTKVPEGSCAIARSDVALAFGPSDAVAAIANGPARYSEPAPAGGH